MNEMANGFADELIYDGYKFVQYQAETDIELYVKKNEAGNFNVVYFCPSINKVVSKDTFSLNFLAGVSAIYEAVKENF